MDFIKIAVIIGLIIVVIFVIFIVTLDCMSSCLIVRLFEKYEDGLNLYCTSPDRLQERLIGIGLKDVEIVGDSVIVRQEKKRYRFYIKEGNVFADIKMEGLAISGISRIIKLFKKRGRLLSAVFYNKIMDILARTYNLEALVEDNGDYNKAEKFAKIYKVLSIGEVLFIVGWLIYVIFYFLTNPIEQVKGGSLEGYPDKEIGETFASYFNNVSWKDTKLSNGDSVVEFRGYFPMKNEDGKLVKMSMDFTIMENSENIKIGSMKIDDKTIAEDAKNLILGNIFDENGDEETIKYLISAYGTEDISKRAGNDEALENNNEVDYGNSASNDFNAKSEADNEDKYIENHTEIEDYIFPDSDTRYLTEGELEGLNKETLRIARNEIYARYGREFKSEDLQEYFENKDWYYPTIPADEFTDNMLSEVEKYNAHLIKRIEDNTNDNAEAKNSGLLSKKEKTKINHNMREFSTWELETRAYNDKTNEYDLWWVRYNFDDKGLEVKKNGSDWTYFPEGSDMSYGDPTFDSTFGVKLYKAWVAGLWDSYDDTVRKLEISQKYNTKGDLTYSYRSDKVPEFVSFSFNKDKRGKLLLKEIISTSSSLTHPDLVITYKYSNEPVRTEE